MRRLLLLISGVLALNLCACRSNYASQTRPVMLKAPLTQDRGKLLKIVMYSLSCRRWQVGEYDLSRVEAEYKNIGVALTILPSGQIEVRHLNRAIRRGHANSLKRWMGALQQTMRGVAMYEKKRLDEGLRAYGISPDEIEKLNPTKQ